MLDLEEIRVLLRDMNLVRVAEAAGIPYGRVYRLVHTERQPSYDTVKKIAEYLESRKLTKAA